jgi:hypothetical protein
MAGPEGENCPDPPVSDLTGNQPGFVTSNRIWRLTANGLLKKYDRETELEQISTEVTMTGKRPGPLSLKPDLTEN